ncbi:MAG: DinB family protein [Terracidiphilus sp.]|jgi:hypothetical protein
MEESKGDFKREYLWELSIPRVQLLALAEAVPEERYGWRPAEDARAFSAVLVHIAAGNMMLLCRAGVSAPEVVEICGAVESDSPAQWAAVIRRSLELERMVTGKAAVRALLEKSFATVERCFNAETEDAMGKAANFFGEQTTQRRLYLRMLAHSHEHMGQAIAYVRSMGMKAPWPDPLKNLVRIVAGN